MWLYRLYNIFVWLTGWPCWWCVQFRIVMLVITVVIILLW